MDKVVFLILQPDGRITSPDGKDVVGQFVTVTRPLGVDLHEYVQEGLAGTFPNRQEAHGHRRPAQAHGR